MKTQIVFLIVALLLFSSLKAQVKIGDNPQNLDPASVLELESNNRVLVITRVTTAQMSTINPLRGALVYNTDEECIHYYNGVEWINICEALDNSFTVSSEAVFNTAPDARDSTVVVTQMETPDGINYNFEVNQITGDNVYNGTLFGSDLAPQTVGVRELQNGGVGLEKLEDGTLAGQLMQWNGTDWTLISEADITVTELDGVVGNEVTDATVGGSLERNGGGIDGDPWTLDVADGGINTDELADNAVTSDKIVNGNITNDKLDKTNIPLSGFGAAAVDVDLGGNKLTNVGVPTVATDAATKNYVDTEITNNAADGTETVVTGGGINVITGDGSAATPYLITATEAQDLADVIALNPSAGNSQITDVVDPTDPQDAATKNYVDNEITNNAADGTETEVTGAGINVVTGDGSAATPYLITATEAQDLADVIALDPSAGNSRITDVVNPTDAQDAATKNYVDTEITDNAADGSETILSNGTDINITGDGTAATPYVINSTFTEAQDLEDVITANASAGNQAITNLLDPTNPQDAATKSYVDTEITDNAADGSETILSNGTDINITGDGTAATPYVINSTFTEAQDLEDVITANASAGNQAITNLLDPTNPQDAATKSYVDTVTEEIALSGQVAAGDGTAGAYTITDASIETTSIIQLTVESSANPTIIQLTSQNDGDFSVQIYEFFGGSFSGINANWQYVVINP